LTPSFADGTAAALEDVVQIGIFIQARMSSRRFPGKVLAPFRGRPIIASVVDAVRAGLPGVPLVVATSTEPSDDPLAAYLRSIEVPVFRGALDDVVARFRGCLAEHPCDRILRVCADSPVLGAGVLRAVAASAGQGGRWDLVTTTRRRTFPIGHNVELIDVTAFSALPDAELDAQDREHVTRFFHRNPERFRILNVESGCPELAGVDLAVDTLDDLARLEAMSPAEIARYGRFPEAHEAQDRGSAPASRGPS
jgi:spore coat polysaccharide biosynthesis protein SpsF